MIFWHGLYITSCFWTGSSMLNLCMLWPININNIKDMIARISFCFILCEMRQVRKISVKKAASYSLANLSQCNNESGWTPSKTEVLSPLSYSFLSNSVQKKFLNLVHHPIGCAWTQVKPHWLWIDEAMRDLIVVVSASSGSYKQKI